MNQLKRKVEDRRRRKNPRPEKKSRPRDKMDGRVRFTLQCALAWPPHAQADPLPEVTKRIARSSRGFKVGQNFTKIAMKACPVAVVYGDHKQERSKGSWSQIYPN
ncbi:hypothetical protein CJ030_MR7G017803 [Morella rubra]|uniref:Uncharacterized protein n=1 Tax=Morella rubra TaxID=262757 RepID=A0A6A1UZ59_9ROSI|nr:hypothetical protein CJ030_MR7G017803 [Morella rubra]